MADFNRDGYPDYLLFNAVTRATVIWYMNNNVHLTGTIGPTLPGGWSVAALGDFNRDGYPGLCALQCEHRWNSGLVHAQQRACEQFQPAQLFQRDGLWLALRISTANQQPDYLLFNASTRGNGDLVYVRSQRVSAARSGPTVVADYDLMGLADFDGNGRPDYLLYNSSTRQTAIWYLNNYQLIGNASGPTIPGRLERRRAVT